MTLSRDRNFDFDTRLQTDTSNLLDDLAGGMQVNQTFVDLELVPIPSLGTFTTRSFTGGNLEHLGRETNGSFDTALFVLGSVDEIRRELLEALNVATRQGDPDFVDFGGSHWGSGSIVFFFSFGDVTHCWGS